MCDRQISAVRAFNRYHTRLVGALDEHLHASGHSLAQARLLYEIADAPPDAPPSASEIAAALRLDPGYLSRLVGKLEEQGLLGREAVPDNAKRRSLVLTEAGRASFARLDRAASEEVARLLAPLGEGDRRELVAAMAHIRRLLGDTALDRTIVLRQPYPGELGRVVEAQARLYAEEYGWDWTFEGLVASIVGQFVAEFRPEKECCRVAEHEGRIVGSVFVVRQDDETAKLRLLYVESRARGAGLGRRLVDEAIGFARARGYRRMVLWTNDVLVSARRIYEASGFTLLEREPHRSFGKDLVGETWGRNL